MSTGTGEDDADGHARPSNIRLSLAEDGETWVAVDEDTGVASQGETREEALAMLDEAVALHEGEAGDPVTDEDLEKLGIDPDSAPDEPGEPDAPWFDEE
jgi:predicted RNase H-like HicB family nuclease